MSCGSGVTPAGVAPSRAAKIGALPGGMPAPVKRPFPSEPTITGGWSGSRAPRPALVCGQAVEIEQNAAAAAAAIDAARERASRLLMLTVSPPCPAADHSGD